MTAYHSWLAPKEWSCKKKIEKQWVQVVMNKFKKIFDRVFDKETSLPDQNRKQVGKNLSVLAIFLFFSFWLILQWSLGLTKKFGVTLSDQAKKVHEQTVIVPAKRGTIYDRNGAVIAEDATTYNVYAIIDKKYKSATGKILYVEESQFKKSSRNL